MAQTALKNGDPVEIIDLEISENYTKIQNYVVENWQNNVQIVHMDISIKILNPTFDCRLSLKTKIARKKLQSAGKCYTNQYLAMMGIVDSDQCPECCNAVETVEHGTQRLTAD